MINKWGGIVVLELKIGEILVLVVVFNYDFVLLVGRECLKNFIKLYYDIIVKFFFDRVL